MKELLRSLFQVSNAMFASSHRIENSTAKKWLTPLFGFGLSHAQGSSSKIVRINDEIQKVTAERKEKVNGRHEHLTSILPKLLPCLAG
jgi:hypothetical protein